MVTVGATDGASTTISWEPSQPGDSPVAAYRVRRDGAVYRQTPRHLGRRSRSRRTARRRFTVTAVDRRGVESAPSEAVRITTGHTPPPTPANVRVSEVTDSAVALRVDAVRPARAGAWPATGSSATASRCSRCAATSARATNLWSSRAYTFSVQAIDTLGGASAPSAPLTVRTHDPEPTEGRLHAFLLASTDQSFHDFQAHYRQIATVHPTYYDCTPRRGPDRATTTR